jgi:hypothetical protein|tara:strand:- start:238 stop:1143 length:906 start_codon:yes stop_codon:yes gene_type:complete
MATSGSKDFDLAVDEYVEEAFERCGLQVRTGYDLRTAKRSLNLMFADWANRGLNRWTMKQETLNLANGVDIYPLGTLTITVGATANFSVAEVITGGTSGATANITSKPSGTSLAITVPVGTFSVGETITGGTSGATTTVSSLVDLQDVQASIDILSVVVRQNAGTSNQSDVTISRISRDSYLGLPSKRTTSRPTQYYIDRQITPVIKLWAIPDSSTAYQLVYDRMVRMDDADGYANTAEVPFRFYPCLSAGLAYYLAIKRAPERVQLLKAIYEEEFERAASEDRDRATLKLTPSTTYYNLL